MRTAIVALGLLFLRGRLLGESDAGTSLLMFLAWFGLGWAILQDWKEWNRDK